MLKIWLTWLQPSLGIMGLILALAIPFDAIAAPKLSTTGSAKTSRLQTSIAAEGTTISAELAASGVAGTPDNAVRRLAIAAMKPSSGSPDGFIPTARQQTNRDAIAVFISPPATQTSTIKASKPKPVKSVGTNIARTVKTAAPVPVPGLYIGNSDVTVASSALPNGKTRSLPIASSVEIGAPTPLSSMSAARGVTPFPVVRPEMMQKLGKTSVVASIPAVKSAPQPLSPVATITTKAKQTTAATKSAPHSLDPIVHITAGFHQEVPRSLDPIADIPAGLQRLLGNDINNKETKQVASIRQTAKPSASVTNPIVALKPLMRTNYSSELNRGLSLKLATSGAYATVPKFNIPGERLADLNTARSGNLLASASRTTISALKFDFLGKRQAMTASLAPATQRVQSKIATIQPQDRYIPSIGRQQVSSPTASTWNTVGQRNNLGGLILGTESESPTGASRRVGLVSVRQVTSDKLYRAGIRQPGIN